ncbi:MAG: ABC transporter permease [Bacteroidetes bacterium SB0662_bin_6]|nr:ABC transporter permease [Bacteroidetes bacterium SB0668_bin_1]MYE04040.1 ABC transporter permease [Bacteroidetes bacterium SB0662_bin_6]
MDFRFLIARRYLAGRRQVTLISFITGISVAGVALGVAALVVVLSVMNGFYYFVRDMLVSIDPHVRIVGVGKAGVANPDSLAAVALELPGVESASAYVEGKALLAPEEGAEVNKVVIVRGVDPQAYAGVSDVVDRTGFGAFDLERRNGRPGLVAGMSLAYRLALLPSTDSSAGRVALLSAPDIEDMATNFLGIMASPPALFDVRGLFEMEDIYDESHVFIETKEAQRLFRTGDFVSGVELRLADLEQADAVKQMLAARLPAPFEVVTWYDLRKSLYDVMRLEKWAATFVLGLIIVVASCNIVGSLTMIVIEKRRDVGVLRAMGVSRRDIRRIFLLEGVMVGVTGTVSGLVIGLGLALLQQHFGLVPLAGAESFLIDAYPVFIEGGDLLTVSVAAIGLCAAAGLYPAVRAAAIEPAKAVNIEA